MRCAICRRPLLHDTVPGLQIGPKCAKASGLLPEPVRRRAAIVMLRRLRTPDDGQIDWINTLNTGAAGASHPHRLKD